MEIQLAGIEDLEQAARFDRHIPAARLEHCIREGQVSVLQDGNRILGVLRWSLFWQMIPFLDLIYIDDACRGMGHGRQMMEQWEREMKEQGYSCVMLSTQADETAKDFYEKLGYRRIGTFLPPEQEAEELMYLKEFGKNP